MYTLRGAESNASGRLAGWTTLTAAVLMNPARCAACISCDVLPHYLRTSVPITDGIERLVHSREELE